jgi:hypothetical protein
MLSKFADGIPKPNPRKYSRLPEFIEVVWRGDEETVMAVLKASDKRYGFLERTLNEVDRITGMTALHIAVGRNNLELTKALVEAGAKFIPDGQGRMPSVIAAEMEVDEELQDYIVEAEAKAAGEGV